jgi:hypothetical protein
MYAKFLTVEDRELAINHQPLHLHDASIRLVRKEEANHISCAMDWVALVLARCVPIKHLGHQNVAAAFSHFGETLEVDAACLTSTDYAIVRAVVRLKHAQFVPSEILLTRLPWGSRLVTLRKIRVWRARDSFDGDGEYIPFFAP